MACNRLLALLLLGLSLSAAGASKIDLTGQVRLRELKTNTRSEDTPRSIEVILRLKPGASRADLSVAGTKVLSLRNGFAICSVPVEKVEEIAELPMVRQLQVSRKLYPYMCNARPLVKTDLVHEGYDLPQPFTGQGVIAGIVDSGMDPNHINFRNEDGTSRVIYLSHIYRDADQTIIDEYGPGQKASISSFLTDSDSDWHGAHTMGIMAGNFRGESGVAVLNADRVSSHTVTMPNPYYGTAIGADIAASCGELEDSWIASGIDNILKIAAERGQRAVINLSLGTSLGAHDGSGMLPEFLQSCIDEDNAIICVAAGNDARNKLAIHGQLSDSKPVYKTFLRHSDAIWPYTSQQGQIEVYSRDTRPLDVTIAIYDRANHQIVKSLHVERQKSDEMQYFCSDAKYAEPQDAVDSELARYLDGFIGYGTTFTSSGRHCTVIQFHAGATPENPIGNDRLSPYMIAVMVGGEEGSEFDMYYAGGTSNFDALTDAGLRGWDEGGEDGSISDLATAPDVISVGAYNSADRVPMFGGGVIGGVYPPGEVSSYSSYGILADGRHLPHICAPGTYIASSSNTHYVLNPANKLMAEDGSFNNPRIAAHSQVHGKDYFWMVQMGTSMAVPQVTAAIAIWLEANPSLSARQALQILQQTAIHDEFTSSSPQWGAGKLDIHAGLKEVLKLNTVGSLDAPQRGKLLITPLDKHLFELFRADGLNTIDIYDICGTLHRSWQTAETQTILNLSSLPAGLYLLRCGGETIKLLLR